MKISYNWLKDFVDIGNISPEDIAAKLTTSGFEVEEVLHLNEHLHDVYVGHIEKIEKHPQADRLVVCQVDVGFKKVQIVTSATNVFEGANVPVSLEGADLANGVQIKPSLFRGVQSDGMFCSGEELGIDDNYFEGASVNGILILPADFVAGTKIEDALLLNDVVFDVNVTPNRPDCNSVVGIARELCAMYNLPFKDFDVFYKTEKASTTACADGSHVGGACANGVCAGGDFQQKPVAKVEDVSVYVDDVKNYVSVQLETPNCPRYCAAYVKDLIVERSPLWLRSRLFAAGIKPINTIVDITNYVLVEQGQPMHAFDYKFLDGHKIVVRQARENEKIEVLNGNTYALDKDVMVIADQNKPVVIAGVIGGVNSCISASTTSTVFECAVFDLKSVRLTAKKFGLATDSSARYTKGVNINTPTLALKRALHLVWKLGCGKIVGGILDVCNPESEAAKKIGQRETLKISYSKVCKILGVKIPKQKMIDILQGLGVEIKSVESAGLETKLSQGVEIKCVGSESAENAVMKTKCCGGEGDDILVCQPPLVRDDLHNENDIAEEVIRIYGYDVYNNMDGALFENSAITVGQFEPRLQLENRLKNVLVDSGFYETLNYSLYTAAAPDKLLLRADDQRRNVIKIANPISEDLSTVRTVMAHALLLDVAYNLSVGNRDFRFFEVGRVYQPKSLPLKELPTENNRISLAVCESGFDFFALKGVMENLLLGFDVKYSLRRSEEPYLHGGVSADIVDESGRVIGWFGKVHKNVLKNYEISQDIYYGELDTDYLAALPEKQYVTKEISKFPSVERDIAIVVDEKVTNGEILGAIKSAAGKIFEDASLFDVYRSEVLGAGKKSLAYKIVFASDDKTLTGDEINGAVNKILKSLQFRFGATLRTV